MGLRSEGLEEADSRRLCCGVDRCCVVMPGDSPVCSVCAVSKPLVSVNVPAVDTSNAESDPAGTGVVETDSSF